LNYSPYANIHLFKITIGNHGNSLSPIQDNKGYYSTLNRVSLVHTSAQVIKQQQIVLLTLQKIDRCNDLCYN
jgi:hypothetical protein